MSKNTRSRRTQRSSVAKANPRSYSELLKQEQQLERSPVATAPAKPSAADIAPVSSAKLIDWRGEYHQVFSDLRQLLVVSAVLIALMITLGYLL